MNVINYLNEVGIEHKLYDALETLQVDAVNFAKVVNALYDYTLKVNTRAKSRFGAVNHVKLELQLTSEFFVHGLEVHRERIVKHNNTLLHEVAHIITRVLWSHATSHGREWKRVMIALGEKPERTGSADFMTHAQKKKRTYKHEYTCQKCAFVFKTTRKVRDMHNRHHTRCGGKLSYALIFRS